MATESGKTDPPDQSGIDESDDVFSESYKPRSALVRQRTRQDSVHFNELYGDIKKPSVGVAMSGGGVRSAMFCSGVLRQLLSDGVRIDFLSSVSGGGYVASSYMDWKCREGGRDHPGWHRRYFEHLLQNVSNIFFRFNKNLLLGAYDVLFHVVCILLNTVVLSVFTRACYFIPLAEVIELYQGEYLRDLLSAQGGLDNYADSRHVPIVAGSLMLASSVCSVLYNKILYQRTLLEHAFRTVFVIAGYVCGVTAIALAFEQAIAFRVAADEVQRAANARAADSLMSGVTLYWCVIVAFLLLWVVFPGSPLRRKFVVVVLMAVQGYVVQLRVFAYYRDEQVRVWMDRGVDWSVVLFLLHPLLEPLQRTMFFHINKNNIERAFYHPAGSKALHLLEFFSMFPKLAMKHPKHLRKKSSSSQIGLTVGDTCFVHCALPEFISQVVANQWTYDVKDPVEDDYKVLTITSRCVDVIDASQEDESRFLDVVPWNIKLSSVMAVSAAAVSIYAGRFTAMFFSIRELCILIGLRVGVNLPVWNNPPLNATERMKRVIMLIAAQVAFGFPLLMTTLFPTFTVLHLAMFSVVYFGFLFLATFPTGHNVVVCSRAHQICDSLGRWVAINLPQALIIREIVGVCNIGHYPGYTIHLSDGGHFENLSLLPLLKRRASFIVIADGSWYNEWEIGTELEIALLKARRWLGCSFAAMDGSDIEADLYRNFVKPVRDSWGIGQPHCWQFKVFYSEVVDGVRKVVDEGRILLLQPRHPSNIPAGSDASGDLGDSWSAEDADNLTGLFSRHLHGRLKFLSHAFVGVFPYMSTFLGNFYTPQTVEAFHREGLRAMSAPLAKQFVKDLPRAAAVPETIHEDSTEATK